MRRTVALAAALALASPAAARPESVSDAYGLHQFGGFALSEALVGLAERVPPGPAFALAAAGHILNDQAIPPEARPQVPVALGLLDRVRGWREFAAKSATLPPLGRALALYRMTVHGEVTRALETPQRRLAGDVVAEASASLATVGVSESRREAASLQSLWVLPGEVRGALAEVLSSFVAFHAQTAIAIPHVVSLIAARMPQVLGKPISLFSPHDLDVVKRNGDLEMLSAVQGMLRGVLAARDRLAEAAFALGEAVRSVPGGVLDASDPIDVPGVLRIDLSDAPNTYPDDYILLIDGGGDDIYLNNAGGTHEGSVNGDLLAAALVDLGGSDRYLSDDGAVNGSGAFGSGFLFDSGGDDQYVTRFAGNGLGFLGSGCLIDTEGHDVYHTVEGGNGAGFIGSGILVDGSGNDQYLIEPDPAIPNNGTGFIGDGAISDGGGDDVYLGADVGGAAAGNVLAFVGRAALVDLSGADRYEAPEGNVAAGIGSALLVDLGGSDDAYLGRDGEGPSNVVVGSAGIGMLYDEGGNDIYGAHGFGLGSGSAGGIAMLLDGAGDDRYGPGLVGFGPSIGSAILGGVGLVVDGEGNDRYASPGGGPVEVQNGAGFLVDRSGDDFYSGGSILHDADGNVVGYEAGTASATRGTALVLDYEGTDRYASPAGNSGTFCGAALLRDRAGDDVYAGGDFSNAYGEACLAAGPGSALLLDEAGNDTYTAGRLGNGTTGE